jgi:hypothetical protein
LDHAVSAGADWEQMNASLKRCLAEVDIPDAMARRSKQAPDSTGHRTQMIDFLGIGAQKCGTTWLYQHLNRHPQIRFPAGKEIHFWDAKQELGVPWWLGLFPDTPGLRQGEITPAYAFLDLDTIAAVRGAAPRLRVFYSMRNPIARAWSSALMALERAEMSVEEASDRWFIDHFNSRGSRQRGAYLNCIQNWCAVFPREQLQLILFDDIVATPRQVLLDLAGHLGVERKPFELVSDQDLRSPVFAGQDVALRPALHRHLRGLYAADIEGLSGFIERDLRHWLD